MKKQILYILLFISTLGFAQQEPMLKVEIDTTNIRIGEQFQYKISVAETKNVILPKLDNLKGLEVVFEEKIDTLKNRLIKKYLLTGFDSGAYYIPQQQVFVKNQAYLTDSLLINVATVAIDTTQKKMFPIKAIKSESFSIKDVNPYLWWLLAGLILIGCALYYFVFRKQKEEEEAVFVPAIPPYEEAMQKLQELDGKLLWQNNKVKKYYSELTEIVRNYIGRDIQIPTLELTTNEIVDLIKTQNDSKNLELSSETIQKINSLLRNADLVKFAKSKPLANDIEYDRKTAEQIINNIQPKVKAYKETIVPEAVEEVFESNFANAESPIKNSPKKKNLFSMTKQQQKRIGFVIGFVLLFVVGSFFGNKISSLFSKYLDTSTTEQLYKGEWKSKIYSNPTISLDTPVELNDEKIEGLPDEVKKLITSIQGYSYQSYVNNLQIALATTSYLPEINADLNGAVSGAIAKLEQTPNVSDLTKKISSFDKNGVNGAITVGEFKENNIEKSYKILTFTNKNHIWILILAHKKGDVYGAKIIDKIINSIEIENELE